MEHTDPSHPPSTPKSPVLTCDINPERIHEVTPLITPYENVFSESPALGEVTPVTQACMGDVSSVQEGGIGCSATRDVQREEVQVTPSSLNQSIKSKISTGPICRICLEGEAMESLIMPCKCSGTVAAVHRFCLERWLNMAPSEKCELCGYRFHLRYTARPFWEFLIKCDNREARQAFKIDLMCLLVLTPMAALSVYLCTIGALRYMDRKRPILTLPTASPNSINGPIHGKYQDDIDSVEQRSGGWEGIVLATVAVLFVVIYMCWVVITFKYHLRIWRQWRVVHQNVALAFGTSSPLSSTSPNVHAHPSGEERVNSPTITVHLPDAADSHLIAST